MEVTRIKLVILTAVLLLTNSKGQHSQTRCITGFLRSLDKDLTPLVPLLGRTAVSEQWIFPEMMFKCQGSLASWSFRGILNRQDVAESCRVHITTWRPDSSISRTTQYERVSTTENNTATIVQDVEIFTYFLSVPVQVEPGDIVGIETGTSCGPGQSLDNILSLNVSINGRSFNSFRRQNSGSSSFNIDSSIAMMERDLLPVLRPTRAESISSITTVVIPPTEREENNISLILLTESTSPRTTAVVSTVQEDNHPQSGSTVAIAAGIIGGSVGLLVLVSVCICACWLSKHVQLHVHYTGKADNPHQGEGTLMNSNGANSSKIAVQANTAYRQVRRDTHMVKLTNETVSAEPVISLDQYRLVNMRKSDGQKVVGTELNMWLNQAHYGTQSQSEAREEPIEHQRREGGRITNNIAYNHGNQLPTETNNLRQHELSPSSSLEGSEYHQYDYIL